MPTSVPGVIRTKGINFRSFVTTLRRLRGQEAVDATMRALPPEIESALRLGAIVASGWYPIEWYGAMHAAMHVACLHSGGGVELSWRLGRDATQEELSGVYRFLLKALSPEALVSQVPRAFQMYFKGGEVRMTNGKKGYGVLEFDGWYGFDRAIWADVIGGAEGILLVRGATAIHHRILRGGGADAHLAVEYSWTT